MQIKYNYSTTLKYLKIDILQQFIKFVHSIRFRRKIAKSDLASSRLSVVPSVSMDGFS